MAKRVKGRLLVEATSRRVSVTAGVIGAIVISAACASWLLTRVPGEVVLSRGGLDVAQAFLSRAVTPALTYETVVPVGTPPLLWKAVVAARATLTFAAAAMSVALAGGLVFGFCASSAWWAPTPVAAAPRGHSALPRLLSTITRVGIAFIRSIHELLWAVLLLAALGLGPFAAVLAIAIPYSGILGKVFSELVDEAPREPALALQEAGASRLQAFFFGLVPQAVPDMAAYAFYRFECAVRSSAVLGFFGFPTLGYYVSASFENLQYGEVWTYLWVLFGIVAVLDWWSGALRRRFVV